jgi:phosphoribosylformimino-5-aminoimidazole carboxamide ribonucleotide (ProFAR) isomerase
LCRQHRDPAREPRYHQQIEEEDPVTQADRRHSRGAKLAHHHDVDEAEQGEHHGLQRNRQGQSPQSRHELTIGGLF